MCDELVVITDFFMHEYYCLKFCMLFKIAGMHHWKHGRKGSGVFWLQQAQDEFRLNRIAQQLFDFVGRSISDESFKVIVINNKRLSLNIMSLCQLSISHQDFCSK